MVLPLVVLVFALTTQLVVVAIGQFQVVDLARRAARLASLADDPIGAARTTIRDGSNVSIDVTFDDSMVTVSVTRELETDLPIVGRFMPPIEVRSRLTVAREPSMP